jgi:hypothetical protein
MPLKIIAFRTCNIAFEEISCLYNCCYSRTTKIGHLINASNFLLARISTPHLFQFYKGKNMHTSAHDCLVKSSIEMEPLFLAPCTTQIQIESW